MKAVNENSNNASFEVDADDLIDFGNDASMALQEDEAEKIGQAAGNRNSNCIFASNKS